MTDPAAHPVHRAVGHFLLEWGRMDAWIEFNTHSLNSIVSSRQLDEDNDWDAYFKRRSTAESRFTYRVKQYRKALVACKSPPKDLRTFDGLVKRIRTIEPVRAFLAHGITEIRDGVVPSIWCYRYVTEKPDPTDPATHFRRQITAEYTHGELEAMAAQITELSEGLRGLYFNITREEAARVFASHSEKSDVPEISAQPDSANSSPSSKARR